MALNDKQQRFVDEYLVDLNATQAATRAGYTAGTAKQQGSRLLANIKVQEAIAAAQEAIAARLEATTEDVLRGLLQIAEHGKSENARVRAYELLGKHLGMFKDSFHELPASIEVRLAFDPQGGES